MTRVGILVRFGRGYSTGKLTWNRMVISVLSFRAPIYICCVTAEDRRTTDTNRRPEGPFYTIRVRPTDAQSPFFVRTISYCIQLQNGLRCQNIIIHKTRLRYKVPILKLNLFNGTAIVRDSYQHFFFVTFFLPHALQTDVLL